MRLHGLWCPFASDPLVFESQLRETAILVVFGQRQPRLQIGRIRRYPGPQRLQLDIAIAKIGRILHLPIHHRRRVRREGLPCQAGRGGTVHAAGAANSGRGKKHSFPSDCRAG